MDTSKHYIKVKSSDTLGSPKCILCNGIQWSVCIEKDGVLNPMFFKTCPKCTARLIKEYKKQNIHKQTK